eukprot:PhM_4_TR25/c0_g1_i1/m.87030
MPSNVLNQNVALRSRVVEEEESMVSLLENVISFATLKSKALASRSAASAAAIHDMETLYKYANEMPVDYDDLTQYVDDLHVPYATLVKLRSHPLPEPLALLSEMLKQMSSEDEGESIVPKSLSVHRKEVMKQLDGAMGADVSTIIFSLYEHVHQDVVKLVGDDMAKLDTEISRLQRTIQSEATMRKQFLANEDFASADTHHQIMVRLQSELLEVLSKRLKIVMTASDEGGALAKALARAKNESTGAVRAILDDKRDLLADVRHDLDAIERFRADEDQRQLEALTEHKQMYETLTRYLEDSTERQTQLWATIQHCAQELAASAHDRATTVKAFLERKHKMTEATGLYDALMRVSSEYAVMLKDLEEHSNKCLDAGNDLEAYCAAMVSQLHQQDAGAKLRSLTLDEARRYASHYSDFVFEANDITTRKAEHVECLRREGRGLQFSLEMAHASLDTNLKQYTNRMEIVKEQINAATLALDTVEGLYTTAADDFEVAREVLKKDDGGDEFEDPQYKAIEAGAARLASLFERTSKFVSEEFERLAGQKKQIAELKATTTSSSSPRRPGTTPAALPPSGDL